jgi:alkylation response protein AidB-like acyl-CoA dehydrogenase
MQFTHEHREIQNTLKRLIDEDINPHVDEWEEAGIFPAHEVFKKLGNLGLLGLTKPEAYGGAGLDYSYSLAMAETLGHIHCGGVPMAIGVQTDMCSPALARFGSPELCAEFLVPAIAGDMVGCIGVSEPGAGSDVSAIKSHARKDGDDYLISGQKMWITNSLQADWMCMLVNTGEGPAHKNKSLVMVPMREGRGGKLTPGRSELRNWMTASLVPSSSPPVLAIGLGRRRHPVSLLKEHAGGRSAALAPGAGFGRAGMGMATQPTRPGAEQLGGVNAVGWPLGRRSCA